MKIFNNLLRCSFCKPCYGLTKIDFGEICYGVTKMERFTEMVAN